MATGREQATNSAQLSQADPPGIGAGRQDRLASPLSRLSARHIEKNVSVMYFFGTGEHIIMLFDSNTSPSHAVFNGHPSC